MTGGEEPTPREAQGRPAAFRPTEYVAPVLAAVLVLALVWWLLGRAQHRARPAREPARPGVEYRLPGATDRSAEPVKERPPGR